MRRAAAWLQEAATNASGPAAVPELTSIMARARSEFLVASEDASVWANRASDVPTAAEEAAIRRCTALVVDVQVACRQLFTLLTMEIARVIAI